MPSLGTITDPTQQMVTEREEQAIEELHQDAVNNISAIGGRDDVHVRDLLPEEDLQVGGDNGWSNTNREWLQSGLTADSLNETYTIDSDQRAQNKIIRFYGVVNVAPDPLTTEIEFQNNTGSPIERAQVQAFEVDDISDIILFERDVQYGADQDGSLDQWVNAAGDDVVIYLAKVAEQKDKTVAERVPTGRGR